MALPTIDLSALPDLDTLTGIFGSIHQARYDDSIVVLATFMYEAVPPHVTSLV